MKNHADYKILYLLNLVIVISVFFIFKENFWTQQQEKEIIIEEHIKNKIYLQDISEEENIEVRHLIQVELDPIFSEEDLKYLSSIIYCEAGNQCLAGKQAVGIVVMNRLEHPNFANSVKGVIYEKGQFSPVSSGSIVQALKKYDNNTLPQECIDAAIYALSGNKTIIYEEEEYEIIYLYFMRSMSQPKIKIQDHCFK